MRAPTITLVVMGVAGSGKTTVARALADRLGVDLVEGDDLHPPANVAKMRAGTPLDDEDRRPWLMALARVIGDAEAAGRSTVVTCSALRRSYRDLLREGHPSVRFVHLAVPVEELQERLDRRTGHFMPASLLASQVLALEPLQADEPGVVVDGTARVADVVEQVLQA